MYRSNGPDFEGKIINKITFIVVNNDGTSHLAGADVCNDICVTLSKAKQYCIQYGKQSLL